MSVEVCLSWSLSFPFSFVVLGIEPIDLCIVGEPSAGKLNPESTVVLETLFPQVTGLAVLF